MSNKISVDPRPDKEDFLVKLQETEIRLDVIMDATPFPCVLIDENLQIIDCNAVAIRQLEFNDKQDLLDNFFDAVPEEDRSTSLAMRKKAMDEGSAEYQLTHILRSGEYISSNVWLTRVKLAGKHVLVGYMFDLREIEAANEETRKAQKRAKIMLDMNPLISSIWSKSGRLLDCNEEALRVLEVADAEEYARGFNTFLNPELQPDGEPSSVKGQRLRDQAFEDGWVRFEWMYQSKSGKPIPVETTLISVEEDDDPRLVAYSRDLRDIYEEQEKTKEAERRMQTMLDATPFACILIDENLRIIDCNLTAVRLLEFNDKNDLIANYDDLYSESPSESIDSNSGDDNSQILIKNMRQKAFDVSYCEYKFTYVLGSGELLPVHIRIERVDWDNGYRLVGYIQDMREIEAANKRIREAEAMTQIMLNESPIAAFVLDEKGMPLDCNDEAVRLYGADSKDELIENFYGKYIASPEELGSRGLDDILAGTVDTCRYEWFFRHSSGECFPVDFSLKKVAWPGGSKRILLYGRDLRELKAKMAEIDRTHDELVKAKDLAESSVRAKSAFLANMSHEIRTPMTAIIGMAQIAKKSDDPEKKDYCMDKIADASEHLLGIINDVLDMSKIEAGHFVLSYSDFMIERMLRRLSDVIAFRIDQKRQEFLIEVDPDVPHSIVTDQQRLSQVIMNLLSNGNKFTPEKGNITLHISLKEYDEMSGECVLQFTVKDSGIGINADQMEKLFQSFEQGDNSISRRYGGTGLGLSISKNIVEQLGGSIWVESTPGLGSAFSFTIKARRGVASAFSRLDSSIDLTNVNVLVVDDMPSILKYFSDIVEGVGIKCRTALNAEKAMEELDKKPADIVFIDWLMPDMDGIELTRQIRRKYGENIIVIMISAMDWDKIETQAIEAGVDRFIAKPLLPSPIIDCINECLGKGVDKMDEMSENSRDNMDIFAGKRILMAEDVEINSEIVTAILKDTGVEVVCAADGGEAVSLYSSDPLSYDLILMDIHMPEVDGYEATRLIRGMEHTNSDTIPIVAMTANVFKEDVERCLKAGMNDHVAKPIDIDDLTDKLQKYLN